MTSVFISYARQDDEPFVRRLHGDLVLAGIDVWFDRASMPNRGLTFSDEIRRAIALHERFVLVVGPKAVESAYVREEWTCALDLDKPVYPVIRIGDVTLLPDRVRLYDARFMQQDADYHLEMTRLVDQLRAAPPQLGALHAVPSLPPHFLERPEALRRLRDAVTADLERRIVITGVSSRVGVQGMGGIGKSVLAAAMARDTRVRHLFPDGIFWVPLGQEPKLVDLQRDLAQALGDAGDFQSQLTGQNRLRKLLEKKQVLVVLDDLWHKAHAEAFDVLGPLCRMLITTRDVELVTTFGSVHYQVQLLSDDEARRLLARWAGIEPGSMQEACAAIVQHCGRLPLALSICGAMIRDGKPWPDVVVDLREAELEFIRHDLPNYPHKDVWKAIKIGVDTLANPVFGGHLEYVERFVELAVFPPDETIPEAAVSVLWSHTGGLTEVRARDLLRVLASKALVQIDTISPNGPSRVSLHDLIWDFASKATRDRRRLHESLLEAYRKCCPSGWWCGPNDGYFLTHLRQHMIAADQADKLANLLCELRWLEVKNEAGMTFDLTADFRDAIRALPRDDSRRKILRLLNEGLRRDIHFIARHSQNYSQALFQCLWNSCRWYDRPKATACSDERLTPLLERWLTDRNQRSPGFLWVRSVCPPNEPLGTSQTAVLCGHESPVVCVDLSPDGSRLASTAHLSWYEREWDVGPKYFDTDWGVRLWDTESGEELLRIEKAEGNALFLPDGQRIIVGGPDPGTVCVYDTENGRELYRFGLGHRNKNPIDSLAISPNGRYLVATIQCDRIMYVWDIDTRAPLYVVEREQQSIYAPAWSADGRHFAAVCPCSCVRVWEADAGREVLCLSGHKGFICSVAFSPDGGYIASGGEDRMVRIWDAETGREVLCLSGHDEVVTCVAYSAEGKWLASGSVDGTIRVWDAQSGQEEVILRGHQRAVRGVVFTPDGTRIVSCSEDKTIRFWDLDLARRSNTDYQSQRRALKTAFLTGENVLCQLVDGQAVVLCPDGAVNDCSVEEGAAALDVPKQYPWRAVHGALETMIERADTREVMAWYPVSLFRIRKHPTRALWTGIADCLAHVLALEGVAHEGLPDTSTVDLSEQYSARWFCHICGAIFPNMPDAAMCAACGKRFDPSLDDTVVECMTCDTVIPGSHQFCVYCGARTWRPWTEASATRS